MSHYGAEHGAGHHLKNRLSALGQEARGEPFGWAAPKEDTASAVDLFLRHDRVGLVPREMAGLLPTFFYGEFHQGLNVTVARA